MSHDLYKYGTTRPIYFKITLDGVGVNPALIPADVKLYHNGLFVANIGGECSQVGTGAGIYMWEPSIEPYTSSEVLIINIVDSTAAGRFDENCLIIATGGNVLARFNG